MSKSLRGAMGPHAVEGWAIPSGGESELSPPRTPQATPGSNAAIDAGCICPVLDNAHGRGFPLDGTTAYWITEGCPLHAAQPEQPKS